MKTPMPPLPTERDLRAAVEQLRTALDAAERRAGRAELAAEGSAIIAKVWQAKARKWRKHARRAATQSETRSVTDVKTYNLALSEQTDTDVRMLAELNTAEPAVMAATLRAAADLLDPPRPAHRLRGTGRDAEGFPEVHKIDVAADDPPDRWPGVTRGAVERTMNRPRATLADMPDPPAPLSTTEPPN